MQRRVRVRTIWKMHIETGTVEGSIIITPRLLSDDRGWFKEVYAQTRYSDAGIRDAFVQDNVSCSHGGVLRGLHGDRRMSKLVQVLQGSAFDVVADLRPSSNTYLKWFGIALHASEHTQLYIPAGCLHGFLALEDGTILSYKQSAEYDPTTEFGIAWNDPDIDIEWPLDGATPRLSPKDAHNPTLREAGLL